MTDPLPFTSLHIPGVGHVPIVPVGELDQAATRHAPPPSPAVYTSGSSDIDITPEFERVFSLIRARLPLIFVTGRAGTGKTTFIHMLRERFEGNLAVLAPTGMAALKAGGQTLHAFCRLPPQPVDLDAIKRIRHRAVYQHLDLIVVDEISMVRADLLDGMDRFLRINGPDPTLPFGGISLVVVGDLFQLPPVVKSHEESLLFARDYHSPFFFSAHCLADTGMAAVELTRVFRQSDDRFLELLNAIREGNDLDHAIARLSAVCFDESLDPSDWMTLTPRRDRAAMINDQRLDELPSRGTAYLGEITGRFLGSRDASELSPEQLERDLPAPMRLRLKPGARVMFTKNDQQKRWVNGTVGVIEMLAPGEAHVRVDHEGVEAVYEVPPATWERHEYRYDAARGKVITETIGAYRQLPLTLAWAVTIHKGQGQTLDHVLVDLGRGVFAPGQTYVALSRCRSMEGLRLSRELRASDVVWDERIARFYATLRQSLSTPA